MTARPQRRSKKPLASSKHKWKENIKIGLREIGCSGWTGFIWLRIRTSGGLL
jgi:hypothetical protein